MAIRPSDTSGWIGRLVATPSELETVLPGEPPDRIRVELVSHGGFAWVKRDDGVVTRIDPATNTPKGEVRADTKSEGCPERCLCQGIGAGGGAVWSCSGSDVVRIDPKRLRVTASLSVGKVFDQGKLVFAGGKIGCFRAKATASSASRRRPHA